MILGVNENGEILQVNTVTDPELQIIEVDDDCFGNTNPLHYIINTDAAGMAVYPKPGTEKKIIWEKQQRELAREISALEIENIELGQQISQLEIQLLELQSGGA